MGKKEKLAGLSRTFRKNYKLFLKGKVKLGGLKRNFEVPNDIVFFKKYCDRECDLNQSLRQLEMNKLNALIDDLLVVTKGYDKKTKKSVYRKVLATFLGIYTCFVEGDCKEKSKEIMFHFSTPIENFPSNETLHERTLELLHLLISSRDLVEDKEAFTRPIIFKLVCLYSASAVSDKEGRIKCNELGKTLTTNWHKSTPESVTLNILKRREKNSKLPPKESELLEEISF